MQSQVYQPAAIEKKWQKNWEQNQTFKTRLDTKKPKYYTLIEFPYPSGAGLHVGHPRPYTALDVVARKRRMEGFNVLHCIGWDAFGLPTENYAIKHHVHPAGVTRDNINNFRRQIQRIGFSFDYDREVDTTDPNYYRWTQWLFLRFFEHGLAYKSQMPINWCPACKIGLANEEVVDGSCERCGEVVEHRVKNQWMLKITAYAQKLLDGLDKLDFIDRVKAQQRNWIGRSEGAQVAFELKDLGEKLWVFTTRADTIFGATYMVLSPEHPIIDSYWDKLENPDEVTAYRAQAAKKSDFERSALQKDKTGVQLKGLMAINPGSGEEIPIYISDYVLMTYGTGAIMAVPAHDDRDWAFAKAHNLPIREVIKGGDNVNEAPYCDSEEGEIVNSGLMTGLTPDEGRRVMLDKLEKEGLGYPKVNYKLRDWVFSRQRYWGEPIPIVHCPHCGMVPLADDQLPLLLPEVDHYEVTDSGESPLAAMTDWVNVPCPRCGEPAKRETDTMPQWAGSSWYFMRYCDPHNDKEFASQEALNYFMPVDWYNGGMEHTTLHLLYSRFWHLFLHDIGLVDAPEPYLKRTSHGMILGENGDKMSKSRGNVVNPDEIIDEMGADAFRLYEMFMGAFDQAIPWNTNGVAGCRRFLDRVWRLMDMVDPAQKGLSKSLLVAINVSIKKVSEDIERMKFNTAIAQLMTLVNQYYQAGRIGAEDLRVLLLLLSPFTPHMTSEMWEMLGFEGDLAYAPWPVYDERYLVADEIEVAVQINGKVRGKLTVPASMGKEEGESTLLDNPEVQKWLDGRQPQRIVYVPGRLLSLVVKG